MARRKAPHIPDALLDQLLSGTDTATALQQGANLSREANSEVSDVDRIDPKIHR